MQETRLAHRPSLVRRGFTLFELLISIAILIALMALLLPALGRAKISGQVAEAEVQLRWLETQLAAYHADHRAWPRTGPRTAAPADLLRDDAPALWAALRNLPTPELGGGQSSPYGKWEGDVGLVRDRSRLEGATMGYDGEHGVERLDPGTVLGLHSATLQLPHGPRSAAPLVFLDPWGRPWHYREWASVPPAWLATLAAGPPMRSGFAALFACGGAAPIEGSVADLPHDPGRCDVWSSGPNGVNELGAKGSDDVASWNLSRAN